LTLLGPRANNDRGFFLGPQLTYLLIPFYLATNLHPSALIYFVIVYCILFFFVALISINKLFNLKTALLFLIFWSLNILLIDADIGPFWPIFIPLGVITTWYCLYQVYIDPNKNLLWLALGLILGFFFNMHFQFLFLFLFTVFFLFLTRKKIKISFVKLIYIVCGIIVMFIPLILFDLRHNFFNLSLLIRFFTEKDPNVGLWAGAWIPVFSNVVFPFLFTKSDLITGILFYLVITLIMILQIRRKQGFQSYLYYSSLLLWISFPIFFSLYGKRPSEYYFAFLNPFIIVSIVDFLLSQKFYVPLTIYLSLFTIFNFTMLYPKFFHYGLNFYEKDRAVKQISQKLQSNKCDIAFNVPIGREVGYKYLFEYYNINTIGDWKTCVIDINIPPKKGDVIFDYIGVAFPKNLLK